MKERLLDLFIELAQPDRNGQSRLVSKKEFIGKYQSLHFTNGCNWMRSLKGQYLYETYGRGDNWFIELTGIDKGYTNRSIKYDIIKQITCKPCVHTGFSGTSQNGIECDHKNGRYNDPNALDINTQKLEHFQPLSRQSNLKKRSDCKLCKSTGLRFDAKEFGYNISFTDGDEIYKGTCEGCYWFDVKDFRSKLTLSN